MIAAHPSRGDDLPAPCNTFISGQARAEAAVMPSTAYIANSSPDCMAWTVLRPMAVGGRCKSTRAAWRCAQTALRRNPDPGAMLLQVSLRARWRQSVAVPKSTTQAGPPYRRCTAAASTIRSRPRRAVFVADAHTVLTRHPQPAVVASIAAGLHDLAVTAAQPRRCRSRLTGRAAGPNAPADPRTAGHIRRHALVTVAGASAASACPRNAQGQVSMPISMLEAWVRLPAADYRSGECGQYRRHRKQAGPQTAPSNSCSCLICTQTYCGRTPSKGSACSTVPLRCVRQQLGAHGLVASPAAHSAGTYGCSLALAGFR